jgi:hypothetical protein
MNVSHLFPAREHDFSTSMEFARRHCGAAWWEETYRTAFPDLISVASIERDGWAQRGGIDRVLTVASGKVICVDEKVRSNDWGDVLLEYWSDRERKVRGWVARDLACDYIAYAYASTGRCLLLPFQELRRAWRSEHQTWVRNGRRETAGFKHVEAKNKGPGRRWTTISVAVPVATLLEAMTRAMLIAGRPAPLHAADGPTLRGMNT